VTCLLYGAVMGATNLLQGSEMDLPHKLMQIGVSALKVPVLFLLTCAIVLPPIYVSNAFVGSRLSFRQMLAVLLSALAVTTTVLASMATVAMFFALTSQSYDFLKLLHVLFFVYAGLAGLAYQRRCLRELMPPGDQHGRAVGAVAGALHVRRHAAGLGAAPVRGRPRDALPGLPRRAAATSTNRWLHSFGQDAGRVRAGGGGPYVSAL
jgi:hypothetical protein